MFLPMATAPTLLIPGQPMFLCLTLTVVLLRLRFMLAEAPDLLAFRLTELPSLLLIAPTTLSRSSIPHVSPCAPPSIYAFIPRTSPFCLIRARRSFPVRDRGRLPASI